MFLPDGIIVKILLKYEPKKASNIENICNMSYTNDWRWNFQLAKFIASILCEGLCWVCSIIVTFSLFSAISVEKSWVSKKTRPSLRHLQNLSHKVVSSTPRLNLSGDRPRLYRYKKMQIQIPNNNGSLHAKPLKPGTSKTGFRQVKIMKEFVWTPVF